MRDLNIVARECMSELDRIGIEYGNVKKFEVNTRAKSRWGRCRKTGGYYIIEVNVDLLDERNDLNGLKETILHELLHSCKDCMNHGKEWKRLAAKVNHTYGYNITRCSNAEEKGVSFHRTTTRKTPMEYKYAIKCNKCGQVVRRSKMSKTIQRPDLYRCGICGGGFTRIA